MPFSVRGIIFTCLVAFASQLSAEIVGSLNIIALRVAFQPDDSPSTTGDGTFLLESDTLVCDVYTIDRLPHDRSYFESHLKAVDHYFRAVSHNKFGINLAQSSVFPVADTITYLLPNQMSYYNPYGVDEEIREQRIVELFNDALEAADTVDYSNNPLVVVFHAGIGQDFSLPFLDPTPEDIPSTYVDQNMIETHLDFPIVVGGQTISHGIVLPETQNHLLFDEWQTMFEGTDEPCDYQFGLTGTFALMIGFSIGLPPLWNTETGESGIGVFGLMDQGSNNGRGLIPAPPNAWTRYYAGWEQPIKVKPTQSVALPARPIGKSIQIQVDDDEYFLVENCTNWFDDKTSIDSLRYAIWDSTERYPPFVEVLFDEVNVIKDTNGVVISIPDYDLGLPASGLLIWHIDESVIHSGMNDYSVNNNRERRGVDLEEADGAQDIGYPSIFLFTDPSSGYFGDMWFKGNLEYERTNPDLAGIATEFSPYTYPDTRSDDGAATFLTIGNIGTPGDTMTFTITNSLIADGFPDTSLHMYFLEDFTSDEIPEIIGGGDSLWWSTIDLITRHPFFPINTTKYELLTTNYDSSYKTLVLISIVEDSILIQGFHFKPNLGTFVRSWTQIIVSDTLGYVFGSRDEDRIDVQYSNSGVTIFPDTVEYWIINDGIIRNERITTQNVHNGQDETLTCALNTDSTIYLSNEVVYPNWLLDDVKFTKLSAIDLDLDGQVEFLALSKSGYLYAFNSNFSIVAGFPIFINSSSTVLTRDLYGDDHPELIAQTTTGEIVVLNWQGEEEYRLANSLESSLRILGDYHGRSSIMTESTIWTFDSVTVTNGNEWSSRHANSLNIRELKFNLPLREIDRSRLLDKSKTYSYPNPARAGKVILRIFVESAEKVDVKIYDLAGYFITKFILKNPLQGEVNEVIWQVNNVESGVYFANITANRDGETETKILKIGIIH